ncbi:MAG: CoA-binding protein [Acidimicrobiales bacterium]
MTLTHEHFRALFDPKGIVVAGAATHPGKFGFVTLHNILANGYKGGVFATNLKGETVLGVQTMKSVSELRAGSADLLFVCTPPAANEEILTQAAERGVKAAFITTAGYAEAGPDGQAAQRSLIELAERLDLLVAGPNGQGIVSTPSSLCAQIVAPYPPAGPIAIASQSGNFVSSFENLAIQHGIGVSRGVSAGNAAMVTVPDYLDYFSRDAQSKVGLAYVEGIPDGRKFYDKMREVAARMPVVLLKGGATAGGQRAAASHTGALAADDRIFDGMCAQAGIHRAASVEAAYEAAATLATQPLPKGPNTIVLTSAGGWGVITADAIGRSDLALMQLPEDLQSAIDAYLPPRWSRNNPVDMAGGETRDTIPELLDVIAAHPSVDAIVYLGLGIQANQAEMMRRGPYFPDHGIERIVAYHERQDRRFAEAAASASLASDKPILTATELATSSPENPGPKTVKATGRICYSSADRAVEALGVLWRQTQIEARRS